MEQREESFSSHVKPGAKMLDHSGLSFGCDEVGLDFVVDR